MATTTSDVQNHTETQPAPAKKGAGSGVLIIILGLFVALPTLSYLISSFWPK